MSRVQWRTQSEHTIAAVGSLNCLESSGRLSDTLKKSNASQVHASQLTPGNDQLQQVTLRQARAQEFSPCRELSTLKPGETLERLDDTRCRSALLLLGNQALQEVRHGAWEGSEKIPGNFYGDPKTQRNMCLKAWNRAIRQPHEILDGCRRVDQTK